jgi:hypothetical protein
MRCEAVQSNLDAEGHRIRNRRCEDCEHIFSTVEVIVPGLAYHKTRPSKIGSRPKRIPQTVKITHGSDWTRVQVVDTKPLELCRRGHPFTPENTYVQPSKGSRSCRICRNAGALARYHNARRKAPQSILDDQRAMWREAYRRRAA